MALVSRCSHISEGLSSACTAPTGVHSPYQRRTAPCTRVFTRVLLSQSCFTQRHLAVTSDSSLRYTVGSLHVQWCLWPTDPVIQKHQLRSVSAGLSDITPPRELHSVTSDLCKGRRQGTDSSLEMICLQFTMWGTQTTNKSTFINTFSHWFSAIRKVLVNRSTSVWIMFLWHF